MKKHKCIVCGWPTDQPIREAFSHFHLWQSGMLQFLKGNIQAFGFWDGVSATVGLCCPIYDTLKNWKHRKKHLVIHGLD
jgi:hypothetical protein